jgi:hypothetical protein
MSKQPRRNEDRFYRYPMQRIVAVIDDDAGLRTALSALEQLGVDVAKVNVLTGPEGARLLDRFGTGHGLRGRLLRLAQRGAFEGNALQAHERALKEGRHVVFVPARGKERSSGVADALRVAGGHYLLNFRMWSIEVLQ